MSENEDPPRFHNNNRQPLRERIPRGIPSEGGARGGLEEGKTESCVDAGAHASEPAIRPSHWHLIRVRFHSRVRGNFIRVRDRGSSPSQLINRQSPRRYAINRLGNRSENRSTRLTPTKTRVAFVAASSCSTTVCLGSESGVEGQLESPGGAARRFQASNLLRDHWPPNLHCPFCQIARAQPSCEGGFGDRGRRPSGPVATGARA